MSKDLVLYGASNPCVLKILHAINQIIPTWNLLGFVDDTPEKSGKNFYGHPILGGHKTIETFDRSTTYFFNNVFGSMAGRKKVSQILDNYECKLTSLISPDADMTLVEIGQDVAIEQQVAIDTYVLIGDHCCVKRSSSIGHETVLEQFVFIGPGATVCGRVHIHEGAYIGAGSCLINNLEIGRDSIIGAGAVVVKNVPPLVTMVGNPAKIMQKKGSG